MKKKKLILFLLMFAFAFLIVPEFYVNAETNETIIEQVTLKYNANGGKKAPASLKQDIGSLVTISSSKPTRSNYKFIGWSTVKDAKTATYKSGNQITLNDNVTLYAVWGKKISITLNANGGSVSKRSVSAYEKTNYPSLVTPKRKGYKFTGWYTSKSGGTLVDNTKVITKAKNHTLYAHWKKITYTITYNLDGGENSTKNKTTYNITTSTFKLNNPSKKGYTFKGWYTSNKYKTKVTQVKKGTTGNKTYYAKFDVNKYKIVYNGNGNTSGKMSSKTGIKYTSNYTLAANKYSKKGYKFVGWNTKKDGSGKTYYDKDVVSKLSSKNNGKVTLYAMWIKNSVGLYDVTFDTDGGTSVKLQRIIEGNKIVKPSDPVKEGYIFKGWTYNNNNNFDFETVINSNITLYAKYESILKTPVLVTPEVGPGYYIFDISYDGSYQSNDHTRDNLVGWEIYEKVNGSYQLYNSGTSFNNMGIVSPEVGNDRIFKCRVYILNSNGEKIYSEYSDEITLTNNLAATQLVTPEEGPGYYVFDISYNGSYYSDDHTRDYLTGWEIYEKINGVYKLYRTGETFTDGFAYITLDIGESRTFRCRVYVLNPNGEKVYGSYSDDLVLNYNVLTPELVTPESHVGDWYKFDISYNGSYQDADHTRDNLDGWEIYEKVNGSYQLYNSGTSFTGMGTITLNSGETRIFKCRVYMLNNKDEKVYSDYSEEVTLVYSDSE